jgi:benzoyl-CoA reductase/2-hydroxyglutaryl-CoA dehydratase subunit BcrC/BadD/HgdB
MEKNDRRSLWPPIDMATHLKNRVAELMEAKKNGIKIIGYFPGNYVPEELIYAAGAIPICLVHGGDPHAAEVALTVVPRHICPFARSQVGERLLKENPFYGMLDMLVAPLTCSHMKKVADLWEYYFSEVEIFKLGVPHQYNEDFALEYYVNRLKTLKERLERFTGNKITDEKLINATNLYNKMRELLRNISFMRQGFHPPLSSFDFISMNQASFYADSSLMIATLNSIYQELKQMKVSRSERPRLLLVGPNIAYGDYKILELVDESGGEIVIEELFEGVRNYWRNIENSADPLYSLAKGYLRDRLPAAFMAGSAPMRLDFAMNLVKDFNISGVIFYELLCCETYDAESYFYIKRMEEKGIPVLIIESEYDVSDRGHLKNRIDAFMEIIKGGKE